MNVDLRLERALDRVELVTGAGDPGTGRMCVMSLVACLAGEEHTDRPGCASPLVRAFAIPLNDCTPREARQRLKPFAPRILGTNDGLDGARAEALRRALAEEILPRASARYRTPPGAAPRRAGGPFARLRAWLNGRGSEHRTRRLLDEAEDSVRGRRPGDEFRMAGAAGRLLAFCVHDARDAHEAERHWGMASGSWTGSATSARTGGTPRRPRGRNAWSACSTRATVRPTPDRVDEGGPPAQELRTDSTAPARRGPPRGEARCRTSRIS